MWIQSYMFISRENPYGSESFKLSFRKSSLLISPNPVVSYILVLKYKFLKASSEPTATGKTQILFLGKLCSLKYNASFLTAGFLEKGFVVLL